MLPLQWTVSKCQNFGWYLTVGQPRIIARLLKSKFQTAFGYKIRLQVTTGACYRCFGDFTATKPPVDHGILEHDLKESRRVLFWVGWPQNDECQGLNYFRGTRDSNRNLMYLCGHHIFFRQGSAAAGTIASSFIIAAIAHWAQCSASSRLLPPPGHLTDGPRNRSYSD
jgi:hypothetical protein